MKVTWFRGTTFRLHAGGQILVLDAQSALADVERAELLSGADRWIASFDSLPQADAVVWRPRKAQRMVDAADEVRPVQVWNIVN